MIIAMVVHNDVRHDARVIKEANSLSAVGHQVTVFGLTRDPDDEGFSFGPNNVRVVLTFRSEIGSDTTLLTDLPDRYLLNSTFMASNFATYMGRLALNKSERIRRSFTYQATILADTVIKTLTPDVVHIHDHVALSAAPVYKHILSVPIVWDAHEIYEDLAGNEADRGLANATVISQNSIYVDEFITINESIKDFYVDKYHCLECGTVLPNASMRSDLPDYDGRLHDAAGLDRSQKILLFQGGMSPHRGIAQLVAAANQLNDHWSVVFMGWGKLKEEMELVAASYPMTQTANDRVCFIDGAPQAELALWTAGASLGIIPYENTGLNHLYCTPNKLWEYPLAGVPILASNLEEMGRSILNHSIGILMPRDFTADDISKSVNALTDVKLKQLRQACAVYAETQNWQALEHRLTTIYEKLETAIKSPEIKGALQPYNESPSEWPVPCADSTISLKEMVVSSIKKIKKT
ncbi:glycosyltransferase [Ahrensia kielensis]|uniref:Glycosyltransferase n=1 Tax=Ahrensia kielensis TaxID=76980 RepID=A0ABU9T807_9HYPH